MRFAWLLVAALLVAACATSGGRREPRPTLVRVIVQNNLRPAGEVTIRLISSTGERRVLGSVPPGSDRTLEFEDATFTGTFQLVARLADGNQVESRSFTLFPAARVEWVLFNNTLNVRGL